MKRSVLLAFLCVVYSSVQAQIIDAYKNVWPVNDQALLKSLNGEWQLKVVKGVESSEKGKLSVPPDFGGFNISEGVTHLKPR